MTDTDSKISLPNWVKWIAQDADGCWWGFEIEPNASHSGWYENEIGRYVKLNQDQPTEDWRTSLRRVQ